MTSNKINKLHERCLRIIYSDKYIRYQELLEKDSSVLLHHINLRILATEILRLKAFSPETMKEVSLFFLVYSISI